jgi:hypothetical protein
VIGAQSSGGAVIGGLPAGAAGPLTNSSGMTAPSAGEKRRGGAGMILGVAGAVAVIGAIGYTIAIRGSHQASAQPNPVTPGPDVSSADPAPKPSTAPVVAPSATPVTVPVPVPSAQPSVPPDPHLPPVKTGPLTKVPPKPTTNATAAPVVTAHTPTKTVPNDGI